MKNVYKACFRINTRLGSISTTDLFPMAKKLSRYDINIHNKLCLDKNQI